MRVLVTGGAGFIGSNFISHLIDGTDHEIVTVDRLTYAGALSNLHGTLEHPRHEFVEGDVRDRDLVEEVLSHVDTIVNFAAETHVDRSITDAEPFVSTNIIGTHVLLSAAREANIDRFVQISTDEVYGEVRNGTATEESPVEPRNPYAATKAGADHLAQSFHTTHDLPVLIVRPSNTFGPAQHTEKLIPKLIDRAARNEPLPLYGDGQHVRTWTFVLDTCRAIETVLERGEPGEIYNVASGDERTNISVAKSVVDMMDASEDLITFIDDRPGHDRRYALDTTKLENLDWKPWWSFMEGLQETVDHYMANDLSSNTAHTPRK